MMLSQVAHEWLDPVFDTRKLLEPSHSLHQFVASTAIHPVSLLARMHMCALPSSIVQESARISEHRDLLQWIQSTHPNFCWKSSSVVTVSSTTCDSAWICSMVSKSLAKIVEQERLHWIRAWRMTVLNARNCGSMILLWRWQGVSL